MTDKNEDMEKEIILIKGDVLLLFLGLAKRGLITKKCASMISHVANTLLDVSIDRNLKHKRALAKHEATLQ